MTKPNYMKFKGDVTTAIDISELTTETVLTIADGEGATIGAFDNDDPTADAPDGFLSVKIGATVYKIPVYEDDA